MTKPAQCRKVAAALPLPGLSMAVTTIQQMLFFEGYHVEQLQRVLTFSRWILGIVGVIFVCVAVVNQWLATRISHLQEDERATVQQRFRSSQAALSAARARATEASSELSRFTAPRQLTDEQIASLRKCLPNGPRGKVVVAWLKVESDAEQYAAQIAKVLTETGFQVTMAKTVWLQLAVKGIYLCARDPAYAPLHAVHIQRCFQSAGLRLRAHEDKKMYSDMDVPDDAIIFVVSGRE